MDLWTEIHWSEGMFLRPHHLQTFQRWMETIMRSGVESIRPFAWGFAEVHVAGEPLENFTIRLDRCDVRMKDGTWVHVPENTAVAPLDFKAAMEAGHGRTTIYFGIPQMQEVRANSASLEHPERDVGTPRYEPEAVNRRDENTGENPQTLYVRRMRGRLFTEGQDMTGYEVVRLCGIKRTDRAGAVPELDELGGGPLLVLQADAGLSGLVNSLADQVEAKDEVLAREAREHHMLFTDGVAANTEHLLKLHVLNEARTQLNAMLQSPVLHPFDVFCALAKLIGHLSIFHEQLVPGELPRYNHDAPGACFDALRQRLVTLLEGIRPSAYVRRSFTRKKDEHGIEALEVELDRRWIDGNLEMFVGLTCDDRDINELHKHLYSTHFDLKLASPKRAPRISRVAVRGLRLEIKSVPAGVLPRRPNLHYFKIDKTIGADRTDYWRECEQERGIRMHIREGKLAEMEGLDPTLYVALKGSGG